MFDVAVPAHPAVPLAGMGPYVPAVLPDPSLPFVLTVPFDDPAAAMWGEARPLELGRFSTLPEAKQAARVVAGSEGIGAAPRILAILDRDARLVLAGETGAGSITWCPPVLSVAEARTMVIEASALRAQVRRARDWGETDLARRLQYCAERREARLVDPLWRVFSARALQQAA